MEENCPYRRRQIALRLRLLTRLPNRRLSPATTPHPRRCDPLPSERRLGSLSKRPRQRAHERRRNQQPPEGRADTVRRCGPGATGRAEERAEARIASVRQQLARRGAELASCYRKPLRRVRDHSKSLATGYRDIQGAPAKMLEPARWSRRRRAINGGLARLPQAQRNACGGADHACSQRFVERTCAVANRHARVAPVPALRLSALRKIQRMEGPRPQLFAKRAEHSARTRLRVR